MENLLMKIPHEISVQTWQLAIFIGLLLLFVALVEIYDSKRKKLKRELAESKKVSIKLEERGDRYAKHYDELHKKFQCLEVDLNISESMKRNLEGQIRHIQKQLTRATDINRKFAVNRAMELVKVTDIPATSKIFEQTYKMIYSFLAGKERISEENNEKQ